MSLHQYKEQAISFSLKDEIVFFGTGYISLKSLEALKKHFTIEAVITKSDRTNSTGRTTPTAVKVHAQKHGVEVHEAENAQELRQIFTTHQFRSRIAVVVDFGVIIPESVIQYFPLGILNSHFSLLPKYRGADPIRASIINGDTETGVTIMRITPQLDDGPILKQAKIAINADETLATLSPRLLELNSKLLPQTATEYIDGNIEPKPQKENNATYTHKLKKSDGQIDWSEQADVIERKIRAYQPWPKASTIIKDHPVIILASHVIDQNNSKEEPGTFYFSDGKIFAATGSGTLEITRLQPHDRKPMNAAEFIRGYVDR